jgi:hypothetical protein
MSNACQVCQILGPKPMRFKVSIPEYDLVFGDEVSIDLIMDDNAVLNAVDTAFLDAHDETDGQSVHGIWLEFLYIWCTLYFGCPNIIRTDSGTVFTTLKWKGLTNMAGIA